MAKRNKFHFISPGQLFNLIQSDQNNVILINLQKANPFEDLGIKTIELHDKIPKLIEFDPIRCKKFEDFEKFLKEKKNILAKIEEILTDKDAKMQFSKRRRSYVGILSNESRIAKYWAKVIHGDFNDLFDPVTEVPLKDVKQNFEKMQDCIWKYIEKKYKLED